MEVNKVKKLENKGKVCDTNNLIMYLFDVPFENVLLNNTIYIYLFIS